MFITEPPGCALSNPALQNILCIYCFWSYSIFLLILVTFDFGYSIFTSFSLNIFNYFKLCVRVCMCAHAHVFVCMCPWMQVLAEALNSLDLQFQTVVNHPMWMLGSEFYSSGRTICSLNCWTIISRSFVTLSIT